MADGENEEKEQPGAARAGNGAQAAEPTSPSDAVPETTGSAEPAQSVDEMATLRTELEEAKDRLLRERAELENYKKRAARDRAEALRYGSETLLRELLPVIDNLERATEQLQGLEGGEAVTEGIEMVRRAFVETLERHGVKIVEAHGSTFDPTVHEAIGHVESEHPANTVIDEHQRGYAYHDRLLRPALVTVGKGRRPKGKAKGTSDAETAPEAVEKPRNDG